MMRISGLATGMDTEQMVADLMRAERQPVNKMLQDRQWLEWQRDDYRDMNLKLQTFRSNLFDGVMMRSNLDSKSVTSSNESNVTATATASATNSTYAISDVSQLASAAYNVSTDSITGDDQTSIDPNESIWTQQDHFSATAWNTIHEDNDEVTFTSDSDTIKLSNGAIDTVNSITVDGTEYTIVQDPDNIGNEEVYVDVTTGSLQFSEELEEGTVVNADYHYDTFDFDITTYTSDGKVEESFTFDGSATLNDVIEEVNGSDLGVNMMYDSFTDQVSITRTETGNFNTAETEGDYFGSEIGFNGSFLTEDLKLKNAYEDADGVIQRYEEGGENAQFSINGLETERQSNTFEVDGVTFTLNQTFSESTTLNVQTNTDDVFDQIMEFVDEYNELIADVNGKTTESRQRDYPPLTDEQKDAMSEKEIEQWEEMARSGTLSSDRILSSGMNQLRLDAYSPVENEDASYQLLSDIGVNLVSDYQARGMFEVDETELRQAIENDAEGVYQLFAANGDSFEEQGVARRMRESLKGTIDSVSDRAGGTDFGGNQHTIGRNIDNINDRISNFERRLQQTEERYWSQFTAMERAIQQANAQADQMFAMMGGGGGMQM
ncbi:flagellar hook-associated protein 2 [Desertibacillus haloalkaliphilus]|uniref:flagellar hook-associated protein 2 n=1 Tax=Desertibacillus haloalkaliphilus TaxID=1328930 RepID=UPI001C27AF7A|nr:flagellar hook-associated protein 2 [Desertibacillus haloalkaliphilus]MBU8906012.1 flagellar hook-associated protein 2 [Desertibacillus haloalkaliphilus]